MMRIIEAGMRAMVQDFGRFGYLSKGLTRGGPMDEHAFLWANRLLSNSFNAAQIEITLGGLEVEFDSDCQCAVTGADVELTLDDETLQNWQNFKVRAGQRLKVSYASAGVRAYLAVQGGFQVKPKWGSCATVTRDAVGGLHGDGAPLKAGDEVAFNKEQDYQVSRRVGWKYRPNYEKTPVIGLIPGFQYDAFPSSAQEAFCYEDYEVTKDSDRMGIRLSGKALEYDGEGLVSEGVNVGSVQVPANGQPIIMMHDRQTLGGYPKLGTINPFDLGRLAQCQPSQTVRFTRIEGKVAQQQLRRFYQFFNVRLTCQAGHNLRS
ncbi:biotin-dependent carboxyltransferase family protein [Idiomarina aminovorans]|uniref:5-oxoprolinase subunit C family protein n=1 Tax=Idiomarina aminovorans TaxID=2914829 RepID=UPI0020053CDF|nr:biotin-dependent carboxyltransferase family protein [Idiomarina sp. ATCH4]MCK7458363.1 biotin-dependent carboxyltransferase family protein [Idiomarina sp. ATCH4]